ncbi:MAG TPA: SAM-dependent methyltransferase [Amycolatopsis sp.]|uniref:SAM-dependent methyltransferase n=1 Tax=Amycolatopsis nalaikhensis TaxID=715472 RepID=A0ABY8Y0A5_9PSEU|nr:SAM-dependent methyltransferase [Amycolatopsis sp. 2-2]WIV61304.1 SAM-dependent methyltransferase [Amycolatopsis sp. 2-2]
MTEDELAKRGIDFDKPNAARVYDYLIGGKLNYAVDRVFAEQILQVRPESRELALLNRKWLRRVVRFGAEHGIRQFLDIGSGMPTVGHVHEVAQAIDPASRVVYVDNEPVAVAHSEIVLQDNDNAAMVHADAEYPDDVLEHPTTERLLDFAEPVMVIMAAFVHFIPDERDPAGLIAAYTDVLALGSYLALSSGTFEGQGEEVRRAAELYRNSGTNVVARSREELRALVKGLEILPPGIVFIPEWRPDDPAEVGEHPELASQLALVARKN